jgi:ABC-type glutathione transport system ATPase component
MAAETTTAGSPEAGLTRQERERALGRCPTPGHCVLRAEDVRKSFHRGIWPRRRTVEVLTGASLMVCQGELVGLVGENGSGKSTLMGIVVGLLGRDGGRAARAAGVLPAAADALGQAHCR